MAYDKWLIADLHFGAKNACNWKDEKGEYIRPWRTQLEHDKGLVERWNSVVKPQDRVYVLGDFAMSKQALLEYGPQLNGKKKLISGNHDIYISLKSYRTVFVEIYGALTAKTVGLPYQFVMTHVPIHSSCLNRKEFKYNVHGHLHSEKIEDPRYLCVSAEQIDYTPIHVDEVWSRLQKQNQ